MTDQADLQIETERDKSVYRPAPEGGLEQAPPESGDYRAQLRSRRWRAAPLENPEAEKTDPRIALVAVLVLAGLTLLILVLGYGILDLWALPG